MESVQSLTDEWPFFISIFERGHFVNFPENEIYPDS